MSTSACCSRMRPEHRRLLRRAESLVDELLQALSFVGLDRVEIPLGVGGDAVHGIELTGLSSPVAEARELLERRAVQNVDLHVHAVGDVEKALLRVAGEGEVPDGAFAER